MKIIARLLAVLSLSFSACQGLRTEETYALKKIRSLVPELAKAELAHTTTYTEACKPPNPQNAELLEVCFELTGNTVKGPTWIKFQMRFKKDPPRREFRIWRDRFRKVWVKFGQGEVDELKRIDRKLIRQATEYLPPKK
jgi:hypothetical protein